MDRWRIFLRLRFKRRVRFFLHLARIVTRDATRSAARVDASRRRPRARDRVEMGTGAVRDSCWVVTRYLNGRSGLERSPSVRRRRRARPRARRETRDARARSDDARTAMAFALDHSSVHLDPPAQVDYEESVGRALGDARAPVEPEGESSQPTTEEMSSQLLHQAGGASPRTRVVLPRQRRPLHPRSLRSAARGSISIWAKTAPRAPV